MDWINSTTQRVCYDARSVSRLAYITLKTILAVCNFSQSACPHSSWPVQQPHACTSAARTVCNLSVKIFVLPLAVTINYSHIGVMCSIPRAWSLQGNIWSLPVVTTNGGAWRGALVFHSKFIEGRLRSPLSLEQTTQSIKISTQFRL